MAVCILTPLRSSRSTTEVVVSALIALFSILGTLGRTGSGRQG